MARYFSRIVWICKNTASQPTIYVQHNFCPFEFHPLQSLTKAGDTVQFFCYLGIFFKYVFNLLIIPEQLPFYFSSEYCLQGTTLCPFLLSLLL